MRSFRWLTAVSYVAALALASCTGGGHGGGAAGAGSGAAPRGAGAAGPGGSSSAPGGSGRSTVLFSDDFSAGLPNASWLTICGGPSIDAVMGNPAPSLTFVPSSPAMNGCVKTVQTFSTANGLTISVDASGDGTFDGMIEIVERHTRATIGVLQLMSTQLTATILAGAARSPTPSGFHRYTLQVDAAGNASWLLDGQQTLLSAAGLASQDLEVQLVSYTQSGTPAHFDNVRVTTP